MASVTLAESAKLSQNLLIQGVIENVITVNRFFEMLPFEGIEGNALAYNRENALGDVEYVTVGDTISAKNPATFTQVTSNLTTIIGDAEVNGLIQATRSNINNQKAVQIASKAKSAGRQYMQTMIDGDGTGNTFQGLDALVPAGQTITPSTNGDVLSFELLDNLMDLVVDKDGQVDYFMMNAREIRAYMALLRALGGASIGDVVTLPSGVQVPAYRGVPIFRNDFVTINNTTGSATDTASIYAGTFDDGSQKFGIAGLTASQESGIVVRDIGEHQSRDETITRVKWYCGFALFNEKGIAVAPGITPNPGV